jgi:hypothetical protein
MDREHEWNSVTDRAFRVDRRTQRASPRRKAFDDWIPVVCFLALVGVVVLGGLLMLLSWVTTTLPVSARIPCPYLPGCVATPPDETQSVPADDARVYEPQLNYQDLPRSWFVGRADP